MPRASRCPRTGKEVYRRYVELTYLRPYYAIPFFLLVFILFLYLLGKFMAAGIGSFFWGRFEGAIHRLPLVRSVYSAAKQVTDFFFSEQQMKFTRVVAVEYPRHGHVEHRVRHQRGFPSHSRHRRRAAGGRVHSHVAHADDRLRPDGAEVARSSICT